MGFQMKYEIKKQYLTAPSKRRSGVPMPYVGFLVGHDTGNPGSTAEGNVGYYERSRNDLSASAHIFVDDNSIVECIPFLTGTPEKGWHVLYNVTKDNAMYGDDANDIAGGVELCWGAGINSEEAYKRFIWVLAYGCYKFKLDPAKAVVGHEVLDPKRKIDPSNGLKYMGKTYSQLLRDVVNEYNTCIGKPVAKPIEPISNATKTYSIQSGDTFWGIAHRLSGISVQDLINWNPHVNAANLAVGQIINISKPAEKKPEPKPAPKKPNIVKPKWNLPGSVMRKGAKGNDVLTLQKALCEAFFYPDKGAINNGCDGVYGVKTENAVKRFQMVHGVGDADGVYGPKTKAALENLLNK